MAELPEFQQKQYAFAAHIRDPENNPAPSGVEDRRMAIYRELFFNNLHNRLTWCQTCHYILTQGTFTYMFDKVTDNG